MKDLILRKIKELLIIRKRFLFLNSEDQAVPSDMMLLQPFIQNYSTMMGSTTSKTVKPALMFYYLNLLDGW